MDEQRFDQIAKRLGQARTRRSALKGLGLAVLGAAGVATGLDVEAKGKGKRQRASDVQVPICVPGIGGSCNVLPCCAGLTCASDHTCQCNLGACETNDECTCAHVTTCGTFGAQAGTCCRSEVGIPCFPPLGGGNCCGPNLVCSGRTKGICQCNTAAGFVNNDGVCECPSGQHVNDAGQCVPDETCIQPGQTCNACHQCCEGSTCTDPTHACDGSGGTCCLNNGQKGDSNHPDLCCSGCVCPDGNCCDASHCRVGCQHNTDCGANQLCCNNICVANDATNCGTCGNQCDTDQTCVNGSCQNNPPQCDAPLIPCGSECINPDTQCCAEDEIGVLCPADPRGQHKCCPAGHTCNPNKNGTFNCGKGHGAQPRHNRGRNRR